MIGRSYAIAGAAAFFAGEAMLLSGLLPASQLGQTPALATLGFVLLVANLPLGDWATARLSALGQLTMPIYLTHVIFSAAVRMVLARLGQDGLIVHLIIGTLAGLAGPLLLVWLAHRVGISALLGFETARSNRS